MVIFYHFFVTCPLAIAVEVSLAVIWEAKWLLTQSSPADTRIFTQANPPSRDRQRHMEVEIINCVIRSRIAAMRILFSARPQH